jgi:hypothetical protein
VSAPAEYHHERGEAKLKFAATVSVVLIPTRHEIRNVTKNEPLWWTSSDYIFFKCEAIHELKEFMELHTHLDSKDAVKILYQPDAVEEKVDS